ncbi:MAG TPA: glycoside hydrolase family 44 protein [Chthonomonadaceae bacterium]|nr:glycoside hydrolase family 44 protein [Chthonomonadaceae bacterium]
MWRKFGLVVLLCALTVRVSADVRFTIDATKNRSPISPLIYGTNQPDWATTARELTFTRLGGNRWTAYNWETNASNAGSDYFFQNDGFLGGGETPGEAVRPSVAAALAAGASVVVTIPMAGYVSADKNGDRDVNKTPDFLNKRFFKSLPHKGAPFTFPPDTHDKVVYQDEFVAWLEKTFPNTHQSVNRSIFYSLDNEPDLWDSTHARLRTAKLTYHELLTRTIDYTTAIKAVAPGALIFGPASYGWAGYQTLQGAPDANGRDFLEFYLAGMRQAEQRAGKRLLDVLDVHWYPEARGGGKRITEGGTDPGLIQARLQAPRSLWDPNYREDSWIVRDALHEPLRLLPRLKEKIARNYPGTKLSITEYNYGGGNHISGALAEADVLGLFGREGVFAAALWHLSGNERFIYSGFAMYRNFDGKGGHFGDTSIAAQTSDAEKSSVYASIDSANPNRMVLVAINKTDAPLIADLDITSKTALNHGAGYQLTARSVEPQPISATLTPSGGHLRYTMPPMSVSTLVLRP